MGGGTTASMARRNRAPVTVIVLICVEVVVVVAVAVVVVVVVVVVIVIVIFVVDIVTEVCALYRPEMLRRSGNMITVTV